MNLLFRIVYAAHANGTHHKLALDALRHLEVTDADKWRRLFLAHAEVYLEGSKAPDTQFKDFKNHVLHVRDNYWGGAPEKVESWYRMLVRALAAGSWHEAAWSAGIMSHYYTDPIHPFHTAQSKAESDIHRAFEWSVSKSYGQLVERARHWALPEIATGTDPEWIKDHVIAGAELANVHYETLIGHYDFARGVVDPPEGLDEVCRDIIAGLLVYAAVGQARLLERAISEAKATPPDVDLRADTVLAAVKVPIKWISRKLEDARERRLVEDMYDEWLDTGTVERTLAEDDRQIRDLHASEVLGGLTKSRQEQRAARRAASPLPQGQVPPMMAAGRNAAPSLSPEPKNVPFPGEKEMQVVSPPPPQSPVSAVPSVPRTSVGPGAESLSRIRAKVQQGRPAVAERETATQLRPYVSLSDDVEAAPSIGAKTAARLEAVGIISVSDLLDADPEATAEELNVRHITPSVMRDWQYQARLVTTVPGLRGGGAQLLVGAGLRSVEAIAHADPADTLAAVLRYAATEDGKRVLREGAPPDLEKIRDWIEQAQSVREAA